MKCTHQCMLSTKKGARCKNKVLKGEAQTHMVIKYNNIWAEVCKIHFKIVMLYLIKSGPVETNEVYCVEFS